MSVISALTPSLNPVPSPAATISNEPPPDKIPEKPDAAQATPVVQTLIQQPEPVSVPAKIDAESQITAKMEPYSSKPDMVAQPERIEEDAAQTVLGGQAQSAENRVIEAREQLLRGIANINATSPTGEKMDLRIPLIDELPDRPMPNLTSKIG